MLRPRSLNAEAALRTSELDLEFTELRAPINGRIGDRARVAGQSGDRRHQRQHHVARHHRSTDPIRLEFTFDERRICATSGSQRVAKTISQSWHRHQSVAQADRRTGLLARRQHDFVDNVIDRRHWHDPRPRGVRQCNGVFTVGMFARVRVPASPPYEALLVPDTAIGTEQARKLVMTVNAEIP